MNMMKVLQEHDRTFITWFKETIFPDDNASKTLRLLAIGPNRNVPTWNGYDGFTLVDLNMVAYKDEPFIMAEQAKQVFYVQDPSDSRLSVVLQGRKTCIIDQNDSSTLDICEISSFPTRMPSIIEEHEVDDVQAN